MNNVSFIQSSVEETHEGPAEQTAQRLFLVKHTELDNHLRCFY